jgi:Na+-transporting NADH:ubiquinone oxidoreductase subunit A
MVHITVTKGLDIPIEGAPKSNEISPLHADLLALSIPNIGSFKLLVQEKQEVEAGELLLQEKHLSPTTLESHLEPNLYLLALKKEALLSELNRVGLLLQFRVRPCNQLVNPQILPRTIFIQAVESAPLTPPAELQLQDREKEFQTGLLLLSHLSQVHLVTRENSPFIPLCKNIPVSLHTVSGPHPAANPSLHIAKIDPVQSITDCIWTMKTLDVLSLGAYCLKGQLLIDQVVAIAGSALKENDRRYVRTYPGVPLKTLLPLPNDECRFISGDPLTGCSISLEDFLEAEHTVLCAIPKAPKKRKFFSFLRIFSERFTATNTYMASSKKAPFTTGQHGERRPFIDASLYEKVMPFAILPMPMAKALLADDIDKAIEYGFLEIVPDDFALADFVCLSKVGMMKIIEEGQRKFLEQCVSS